MNETLSGQSIIVVVKDLVSCDLAGEAAVLNLNNGIYYGLNPLGTRVWNLVQESKKVDQIRDILLEEYEVDPARCESDLLKLLGELADRGLIEVRA